MSFTGSYTEAEPTQAIKLVQPLDTKVGKMGTYSPTKCRRTNLRGLEVI